MESGDAIFRSELKTRWRLQAVSRSMSNARNKNPSMMEGLGEVVELRPDGVSSA